MPRDTITFAAERLIQQIEIGALTGVALLLALPAN